MWVSIDLLSERAHPFLLFSKPRTYLCDRSRISRGMLPFIMSQPFCYRHNKSELLQSMNKNIKMSFVDRVKRGGRIGIYKMLSCEKSSRSIDPNISSDFEIIPVDYCNNQRCATCDVILSSCRTQTGWAAKLHDHTYVKRETYCIMHAFYYLVKSL